LAFVADAPQGASDELAGIAWPVAAILADGAAETDRLMQGDTDRRVRARPITDEGRIYVGCAATARRRIRRHLLREREFDPAAIVTRGYWKPGRRITPITTTHG